MSRWAQIVKGRAEKFDFFFPLQSECPQGFKQGKVSIRAGF